MTENAAELEAVVPSLLSLSISQLGDRLIQDIRSIIAKCGSSELDGVFVEAKFDFVPGLFFFAFQFKGTLKYLTLMFRALLLPLQSSLDPNLLHLVLSHLSRCDFAAYVSAVICSRFLSALELETDRTERLSFPSKFLAETLPELAPSVKSIDLNFASSLDSPLEALTRSGAAQALCRLALRGVHFTAAGLLHICKFPSLQKLDLSDLDSFSPHIVTAFANELRLIETLRLPVFDRIPAITVVEIVFAPDAFPLLRKCPLEPSRSLELEERRDVRDDVPVLSTLLRVLRLRPNRERLEEIIDNGVWELSPEITAELLRLCPNSTNLWLDDGLDCSDPSISDRLSVFKNVKNIYFTSSWTGVTTHTMETVLPQTLRNLRHLVNWRFESATPSFSAYHNLRHLFFGLAEIPDQFDLPPQLDTLSLEIGGEAPVCPKSPDALLSAICSHGSLRDVGIRIIASSPVLGLQHVTRLLDSLQNLEQLHLRDSHFPPSDKEFVVSHKRLRSLPSLHGFGVKVIAGNLPMLANTAQETLMRGLSVAALARSCPSLVTLGYARGVRNPTPFPSTMQAIYDVDVMDSQVIGALSVCRHLRTIILDAECSTPELEFLLSALPWLSSLSACLPSSRAILDFDWLRHPRLSELNFTGLASARHFSSAPLVLTADKLPMLNTLQMTAENHAIPSVSLLGMPLLARVSFVSSTPALAVTIAGCPTIHRLRIEAPTLGAIVIEAPSLFTLGLGTFAVSASAPRPVFSLDQLARLEITRDVATDIVQEFVEAYFPHMTVTLETGAQRDRLEAPLRPFYG